MSLGTNPVQVFFQRPQFPPADAIERYFAQSRETRWFSNFGPCHELLSERMSARLGGVECVPLASGTAGLIAALLAMTAQPVVERRLVIMPSFTFVATANAALLCGLEPLFVDVDSKSWHLDPDQLDIALGTRAGEIAAVMAVTAFGSPPPIWMRERWRASTASAGVPLIVDAAAGFGAIQEDGSLLGTSGDLEVFSFHATKPFAIGEGGMLVTGDPALAAEIRRRINFGFDAAKSITVPFGFNGKLCELPSAVALATLDRFDDLIAGRRARAAAIRTALDTLGFTFQEGCEGSPWQFVPVLNPDATTRDAIVEHCLARGVQALRYYHPLHTAPAFSWASKVGALSVTEELAARSVSLPMANDLSDEAAALIVESVSANARHEKSQRDT